MGMATPGPATSRKQPGRYARREARAGLTIAGKIPIVHATFALFPSKNPVKAHKAYRPINDLKIVLPIVTLVLPGLGVFIARRPRRALIGGGLGSPRPCWCSSPRC